MHVAKRLISPSLPAAVLAVGVLACSDDISAPGVCPEFCPTSDIETLDTVLTNVVSRDSSYTGYVFPHAANRIQVTNAGADVESRGIFEILRFPEDIQDKDFDVVREMAKRTNMPPYQEY